MLSQEPWPELQFWLYLLFCWIVECGIVRLTLGLPVDLWWMGLVSLIITVDLKPSIEEIES